MDGWTDREIGKQGTYRWHAGLEAGIDLLQTGREPLPTKARKHWSIQVHGNRQTKL